MSPSGTLKTNKHMNTESAGHVTATKEEICTLLRAFINTRPGLDFRNYGTASSYRGEVRRITRQRADALQLLRAVELRDSIEVDELIAAFPRAYGGRLELTQKNGKLALHYCAGQYYPTEYRAAVCAVLARCLWVWVSTDCMPRGRLVHNSETGETFERYGPKGQRAGDYIRAFFRREFGRGIASRWFS
jgi:hypothetical protein